MAKIDLLKRIQALREFAYHRRMDIDWETATAVPYSNDMPRYPYERGDNEPADPEQAGWHELHEED
jgi:hypothetical protein